MRRSRFVGLWGGMAGLLVATASAEWNQAGGTTSQGGQGAGIVGQGYETPLTNGGDVHLQSGFLAHRLFHLNTPFLVGPVSDLRLVPGREPARILLSQVFAELDGDSLVFEATIDGAVVAATLLRDTLQLRTTGNASGSATVSVRASDADGSVSTSFEVLVEPSTSVEPRRAIRTTRSVDADARVRKVFAKVADGSGDGYFGKAPRDVAEGSASLEMDILLPGPSLVSVAIFDNLGVPVISWSERVSQADLSRITPESDGRRAVPLQWNLRTRQGRPVPAGVYLWKISVRTDEGREYETVRRLGVKER